MSGADRLNVFPSQGTHMMMKHRLAGAHRSHGLLKRKIDALQYRFRMILRKIIETKSLMGDVMKEAAFSLTEAKFANPDFVLMVIHTIPKKSFVKIKTHTENVAGVCLPQFEYVTEGSDSFGLAGLSRGGQHVARLKKSFQEAGKLLVDLATLQTSFLTLDEVIKVTNRRVNAIDWTS
ncbi:V-type proton ATPase subunit D isoform X3 [Tribolium castaneum]|uniref:V-type proton ATPase subunit D isoform X3 n=1 Tax=Tribolium castaneum TaxID=7070 RepID=UPI00077DBDA2|nr:PREDICTED: V-type proton ATPase subunit D isoform X2 [Tribolium castaneum]|eukprot:XP_015834917.1 PREDICTED: V-type proton ATPase subunit D isoform X2 [Tribolium castaneum]